MIKKLNLFLSFLVCFSFFISFTKCNYDENIVGSELQLNFKVSQELNEVVFEEISVEFTELNTKKVISQQIKNKNQLSTTIANGNYEAKIIGKISYTDKDNVNVSGVNVSAYVTDIVIKGKSSLDVYLNIKSSNNDFIIEEIFYAGTTSETGNQYTDDVYFKIYNNTDGILYADGLLLAKSSFQTIDKKDYKPWIIDEYFSAESIIQLPGTGKKYPVNPGKYIVIAVQGINHKENNKNSLDLSKADFEIYQEDTGLADNPLVENTNVIFDKFVVDNRGYYAYAIFRLDVENSDINNFLTQNRYTINWEEDFTQSGLGLIPYDAEAIKIPNKLIIDAVNLSASDEFQWIVTSQALDEGYSQIDTYGDSPKRYGKSVRRVVLSTNQDGTKVYKDTNNSSQDFKYQDKPSLF